MTSNALPEAPSAAKPRTHKDLLVWQHSMDLVLEVYRVTTTFPSSELYGLVSQMRRAAVSIPSNIAEGAARRTQGEYKQFAHIALGSLSELETQLILTERLGYGSHDQVNSLLNHLDDIRRLLCGLIRHLE